MLKKATFLRKSRFFLLHLFEKNITISLISGKKCYKVG